MFKSLRDVTIYMLDWSRVPGPAYRVRERRQLRTLSLYLSAALSFGVAGVSLAMEHPAGVTLALTALGIVTGRCAAGVIVEMRRLTRARLNKSAGIATLFSPGPLQG